MSGIIKKILLVILLFDFCHPSGPVEIGCVPVFTYGTVASSVDVIPIINDHTDAVQDNLQSQRVNQDDENYVC